MPFWDKFFGKQELGEMNATVPLNNYAAQAQQAPDNYANFSKYGYGKNEIVHACIRELSTAVATPRYYIKSTTVTDGGIEELPDSPMGRLLVRPNPQDDMYSWMEKFVTYLYVAGNVYILKERSRTNAVTALWMLRPDRVAIVPSEMGVNTYIYTIDGKEYHIPSTDIAHMSFPNPAGDVYGLSPLSVLSKIINLDSSMTDFAKMYFQNSGVPSGLLKVKRRINSQEEASMIRSRWRSTFGGTNNMHKVAVLDDDAEYQAMASAPKDMDLTGLHYLTETRICSVFGVPPILISANVGLARGTYANYKEARMSFHSETVAPLVARIIRFMNYCLQIELGTGAELAADFANVLAPLDSDNDVANRVSLLYASGILTLNESRQMVGQKSVEDGDEFTPVGVDFGTDNKPDLGGKSKLEIESPKQLKAAKPLEGSQALDEGLIASREKETNALEKQLEGLFSKIRDSVNGVLGRYMERQLSQGVDVVKALPMNADELLPLSATNDLAELFYHSYVKVTKATYKKVDETGIIGQVAWSEKDPIVTGILSQAGGRANMIHSTTKKRLQKAIETAMTRGYTVEQLARGVSADNFKGVQAMMSETTTRSRLIARTEVMRSQNMTTTKLYKRQGYNYVQAVDIDGGKNDNYVDPADPYGANCAQRHGRVYRSDDAYNIMDHPNGTLSWMPMPSDYKE